MERFYKCPGCNNPLESNKFDETQEECKCSLLFFQIVIDDELKVISFYTSDFYVCLEFYKNILKVEPKWKNKVLFQVPIEDINIDFSKLEYYNNLFKSYMVFM